MATAPKPDIGREPDRGGHRRQLDPRRDRVRMETRLQGALADIGCYRVAARRDVVDTHFDGHPYAAARGIQTLVRRGHVEVHTATGPEGRPFQVLTVTAAGAEKARHYAAERGLDPGQRTWAGVVQKSELRHDVAIYRAGRAAARALEARRARVRRIRIDAELKMEIARQSELARVRDGSEAADRARGEAARALDLPEQESGAVLYPDVQLEYVEADGVTRGHVNVEVVTEQYRSGEIVAKASAGFRMHGSNTRAAALISRALGRASGDGRGGSGRPGRGVMEL